MRVEVTEGGGISRISRLMFPFSLKTTKDQIITTPLILLLKMLKIIVEVTTVDCHTMKSKLRESGISYTTPLF